MSRSNGSSLGRFNDQVEAHCEDADIDSGAKCIQNAYLLTKKCQ